MSHHFVVLRNCVFDSAAFKVLEATARAITFYLDVSAECTRRIVAVDGAVKAMCNRLVVADVVGSRVSKDLAEQCIKVNKFGRKLSLDSLVELGSELINDSFYSKESDCAKVP